MATRRGTIGTATIASGTIGTPSGITQRLRGHTDAALQDASLGRGTIGTATIASGTIGTPSGITGILRGQARATVTANIKDVAMQEDGVRTATVDGQDSDA